MLFRVICEKCGGLEVARAEGDSPHILEGMLIAAHTGNHKTPHFLTVRVEGMPKETEHDLLVRCTLPECLQEIRELRHRAPMSLMGALTISHHTLHEGHPIEVWIDGKCITTRATDGVS